MYKLENEKQFSAEDSSFKVNQGGVDARRSSGDLNQVVRRKYKFEDFDDEDDYHGRSSNAYPASAYGRRYQGKERGYYNRPMGKGAYHYEEKPHYEKRRGKLLIQNMNDNRNENEAKVVDTNEATNTNGNWNEYLRWLKSQNQFREDIDINVIEEDHYENDHKDNYYKPY